MSKKPKELEALERAFKSVIMMPQCEVVLVIATSSYLKDYFEGQPDIVVQVQSPMERRRGRHVDG